MEGSIDSYYWEHMIYTQIEEVMENQRTLCMRNFGYVLIIVWLLFSMVMRTRGGGFGSGSGAGIKPIDEQMQEFILSDITHSILEQTLVIFGTVKEGIIEILDKFLGTFHTEIRAIMGDSTLSFCLFHTCGDPEFFREKDPIASSRWLVDMVREFQDLRQKNETMAEITT